MLNELVAVIKAEVTADIEAGVVPSLPESFDVLHNFVDANMYGSTVWEPVFVDGNEQAVVAVLNAAHQQVDEWLKAELRGN